MRADWQIRWLIQQGWLDPSGVEPLHRLLRERGHDDAGVVLAEFGAIDAAQLTALRAVEATMTPGSFAPAPPSDFHATVEVPAPVTPGSALTHSSRRGPRAGQTVGSHQLLEELSRGGMGVVFRARGPDGHVVALKTLQAWRPDDRALARFEREARVLTRLSHPGVVRTEGSGVDPELGAWLAMELVEGPTLRDLVRDAMRETGEPPEPEEVIEILLGLASALAYCHEMGVVHRDLKPSNVVLSKAGGRPILIDFGLVKSAESGAGMSVFDEALSQTGELLGTPAFMSPEQFEAGAEVGLAADVWAFGAVMVYALTGEEPFRADTAAALQAAIVGQPAPRLSERDASLPPALDELCAELLSREPGSRPSMREVERRLADDDLLLSGGLGRQALALVAALVLVAAALTGVALYALRPPPELRLEPTPSEAISEDSLTLRGRASGVGGGVVRVGRAHTRLASDESFELRIPLEEGELELSVELAATPDGPALASVTRRLTVDRTPPGLVVQQPPENVKGSLLELFVRVSEPCRVSAGKQTKEATKAGTLTFTLSLEAGVNRIELVAIDAAGLRSTAGVTVRRAFDVRLKEGEPIPRLDRIEDGPRTITLEPGTWTIEREVRGEVLIRGVSDGVILVAENHDVLILRGGKLTLENLTLRGVGKVRRRLTGWPGGQAVCAAVRVFEGAVEARRCTFEARGGSGCELTSEASSGTFENCLFQTLGANGVAVYEKASCAIRDSNFSGMVAAAAALSGGVAELRGCEIRIPFQTGVFAGQGGRVDITDSRITGSKASGLMSRAGIVNAKDVQIEDCGKGAVEMNENATATLTGVSIRKAGGSGVSIRENSRLEFKSLSMVDLGSNGLIVYEGSMAFGDDLTVNQCVRTGVASSNRGFIIVRGFSVAETGQSAVGVGSGSYAYLANGKILQSGRHGVRAENGRRTDLVNVRILESQGFGVVLRGGTLASFGIVTTANKLGGTSLQGTHTPQAGPFRPRTPQEIFGEGSPGAWKTK